MREFSKTRSRCRLPGRQRHRACTQLDKHRWLATPERHALVLTYEVAPTINFRCATAWLTPERADSSTPPAQPARGGPGDEAPHVLEVATTSPWPTGRWHYGLRPSRSTSMVCRYRARHYDELADSPVEMGAF